MSSSEIWNASYDIEQALEIQSTPHETITPKASRRSKRNDTRGANRTSRKELSTILHGVASDMSFHVSQTSMELAVEAVIEQGKRERKEKGLHHDEKTEPSLSGSESSSNSVSICTVDNNTRLERIEDEAQTYQRSKSNWRDQARFNMWLMVYCACTIAIFVYATISTLQKTEAINVFGLCLAHARACAILINVNSFFVLIPVSRSVHTWLQSRRRLRKILAFDTSIDTHKLFGGAFLIYGVAHTLFHIATYKHFVLASDESLEDFFGTEMASTIPHSRNGRIAFLLQHRASITGFGMLFCMAAATAVLFSQRTNFNRFWYLHHLFVITLILLCIHGSGSFIAPSQTKYWLLVPLSAYLIPRLYREFFSMQYFAQHIEARGSVLAITMIKPISWEKTQKAGMYALINIPSISQYEWHPFTISSHPNEDHIKFHISCAGDWTNRAKKMLVKHPVVPIRLDGPFGAPCQGTRDFEVVVLIGAGIGVTPMMSTLCSMLHRPGKMKRVFFYWTTRESSSFSLFSEAMDDLYEQDTDGRLEIRHFLTGAKAPVTSEEDAFGASLFQMAADKVHEDTDIDIRLGHRSRQQLQIGRPNWNKELSHVLNEMDNMQIGKAGVFLCGPERMSQAVESTAVRLSSQRKGKLVFTKEIF